MVLACETPDRLKAACRFFDHAECGNKHRLKQRPIREQESRKWLHSLEKTAQLQKYRSEVHLINLDDREGDIYDYFVTAQRLQIDVLVRAAWERCLAHGDGGHLWTHLAAAAVAGELDIEAPRQKGKPARPAMLSVRYRRVSRQHRYLARPATLAGPCRRLAPVARRLTGPPRGCH